jgi:NodT family efflux transporter outer membrane factor (OMF) lipoprotein
MRRTTLLTLLLTLAATALPSCVHPTADVNPPLQIPEEFSADGAGAAPAEWWTAFDDEQLNSLVEQALADNFSLRVAWDRLDQAEAVARAAGSSLWPSLTGTGLASRTASRTAGRSTYTGLYSLGLTASYEVDLWGRVRSTSDAAGLDAMASAEDLQAAAITVSAQVAEVYVRLVEHHQQRTILNQQIDTNDKYLRIITERFRKGRVPAADVLQQEQLLESTRGELVLTRSAIAVLEHQLAVLLGRPPGSVSNGRPEKMLDVPPLPTPGLPADLIRRRPDLRAAERRVQAADHRVAAAIADQWPRLSLSADAATSGSRTRDLFDNWLATIAGNVTAPLFDAGLRQAEVDRTRAVLSERINSYGAEVLAALAEVEDALMQEARQSEYVDNLARQIDLSQKATERTLDQYSKGGADFTRYLTTLLNYQRLQRTYVAAQRDLVLFRIDLYRALAGSWPLDRPQPAGTGAAQESPSTLAPDTNGSSSS